ncbi:MAG: hypothetical protein HYT64_00985 [Candidatus Yanofskybacteria bacterium]|nr:hypothetical protein [Candidatus Yanofskybacteria bacterium]
MNKKTVFILSIPALIILALLAFLFFSGNLSKKNNQTVGYSIQMNGKIKEVKTGSIVIEGVVKSTDPVHPSTENRTIEFVITGDTILKNSMIVFAQEQLDSGKSFSPEIKSLVGKVTDLKTGLSLRIIRGRENLFKVNKTMAIEVDYITYNYP